MPKVSINPPKTPVTKGSNTLAIATLPNICKMPGPPAPFVPVPLPNIGKSGSGPKGYSKKVKIEGNTVAIRGATFTSIGDAASKGTGGGLISANTHGPTKFIGPGSMDVKIEGKNVHLLGDPMLNNCGPSGSPPNSATLAGAMHAPLPPDYGRDFAFECPACSKSFAEHPRVENTPNSAELVTALRKDLVRLVTAARKQRETLLDQKDDEEEKLAEHNRNKKDLLIRMKRLDDSAPEKTKMKARIGEESSNAATHKARLKVINQQLASVGGARPFFMLGVMGCEVTACSQARVFAAMSADEASLFEETVKELNKVNKKGVKWVHVKRGPVVQAEYLAKNSQLDSAVLAGKWERLESDANRGKEATNRPGQCAAQKLLAVNGHRPATITEMFYAAKSTKKVKALSLNTENPYLHWLQRILVSPTLPTYLVPLRPKPKSFGDGEMVPSCDTCRELLPFLLCEEGSCSGSDSY